MRTWPCSSGCVSASRNKMRTSSWWLPISPSACSMAWCSTSRIGCPPAARKTSAISPMKLCRSMTATSRSSLQPLRQKAPWLEPGDEWRSHVPVSCLEVRIVRQHLANCILFGRSVVKRSHGEKHDRRLDVLLPGRRDVPLAGALAPDKHLLTAHGAGRCGHSSGATGANVLGRWTGRLRRPCRGASPRALGSVDPEGESNSGGADQNLPHSCGGVSVASG